MDGRTREEEQPFGLRLEPPKFSHLWLNAIANAAGSAKDPAAQKCRVLRPSRGQHQRRYCSNARKRRVLHWPILACATRSVERSRG
jgi:hypothetical protein